MSPARRSGCQHRVLSGPAITWSTCRSRNSVLAGDAAGDGVAAPGGASARTVGPQCRAIVLRRIPDADLTTTSHWPLLVAAQEEDKASLEVAGLVEESDESAGDGGREAAVLSKGFGGDEDEAGVCLPSGAVLGIEGHEVLDVGCDQGASGCRCVSQYLIVGKRDEGRVVDHGQRVMALGAQLLGDGAGEHLVQ